MAIPVISSFLLIFIGISVCLYYLYTKQRKTLEKTGPAAAEYDNLSRLLDSLPVPVSIIENMRGRIVYVNKTFLETFEIPSYEEAYNLISHDLVMDEQKDSLEKYDDYRAILSAPGISVNEASFKTFTDKPLNLLMYSTHTEYNGASCTIGLHFDISAFKKSQKAAYRALKREKDENAFIFGLLSRLYEDLAVPISSINSLLETQSPKNASRETLHIFRSLKEESRKITQILNDNQNLTNVDILNFTLQEDEFELDTVLSAVLAITARHFDERSPVTLLLNTALNLPRFFVGDKRRLWLILKSFLDNCAKYVTYGKIVISVNADTEHTDDTRYALSFLIKDSCADPERIVSITSIDDKTYGIGAARKLITLLGGHSSIEHDKTGVLFKFSLPFKRSANTETTMQAIDTPVLFGKSVLIIDSDELSLKIMARLLDCSNARTTLAKDGIDAAAEIGKKRASGGDFDIIITDNEVDNKNELLSVIRLPACLLLADMNKNIIKPPHIAAVIEKPFVATQFIKQICAVIGAADTSTPRSYPQYKDTVILVCDDNIINQETTANMLSLFGIHCVMAENGKEAVDLLKTGQAVDLVFMDLYMPVMDGFDATRAIRRELGLTDLPIISLSSDAMPQVIEKCIESGMNGHLPKPIEFRALNDVLMKRIHAAKRV